MREPFAKRGVVIATTKINKPTFFISALATEAPGVVGRSGGVCNCGFAEGGVAIGGVGGARLVEKGVNVATEVVEGDVGGAGSFDEDGGTDFSAEAFAEDAELAKGAVDVEEAYFVFDGVEVAFGGGVGLFADAAVKGVVGVLDSVIALLDGGEPVEGIVVIGDVAGGGVHDSAVAFAVVLVAIFGVMGDEVEGVEGVRGVVFFEAVVERVVGVAVTFDTGFGGELGEIVVVEVRVDGTERVGE